jgi:uroporphyrinogen-III synthase
MPDMTTTKSGFGGRRVLALESRRAREMSVLITNNGGLPIIAPATREIPAEDNGDAVKFAAELKAGHIDVAIFLTGVGTRALVKAVEPVCSREEFVAALRRITVIARGPKPVAALRELDVPIAAVVPEPNTWRELLALLDQKKSDIPLKDRRVAVQEYGVPSPELLAGLADRGARVLAVRIYGWSLPEDTAPLRDAVHQLATGKIDVLVTTAAVQIRHLLQVAQELNLKDKVLHALSKIIVGSIGPVTSAELKLHGITPALEPSHPKMGLLVQELAQHCSQHSSRSVS